MYLIYCTDCLGQYVGCTTRKMKIRIGNHKWSQKPHEFRTHTISGVHVILECYAGELSRMSVTATERVQRPMRGGDWSKCLRTREAFWIHKMNTRLPNCLNLKTDLTYFYWFVYTVKQGCFWISQSLLYTLHTVFIGGIYAALHLFS